MAYFMKKLFLVLIAFCLLAPLSASPAKAGDCFEDPVYSHDWTGTVTTGAFVRDVACMDGSVVMTTLAVNTRLAVTGETDGWWRVRLADGREGWVGQWLMSVSEARYTTPTPAPEPLDDDTTTAELSSAERTAVRNRTSGYILLQVEEHGEAWYVDPLSDDRYYMKDGPTAYEMMRTFGLGMTEADYARLAAGNAELNSRLRGRIVLRVELHGEAYYIHPNGTVYYLQNGEEAYRIMRLYSLGITTRDLGALTERELKLIPYDDGGEVLGETDEQSDLAGLQARWLGAVNDEREARGVSPLMLEPSLQDTAAAWAAYMGQGENFTHVRPDGKDLNQWFAAVGHGHTYVGENLALVFADGSKKSMDQALDDAIELFLSEKSWGGLHYQNLISDNWDATGLGYYLLPNDAATYKVYFVFHFASAD